MPRSFLVKKYFSNKKPYYRESQLESQTGKFLSFTELNALVITFDKFKPRHELITVSHGFLIKLPSNLEQTHMADRQVLLINWKMY